MRFSKREYIYEIDGFPIKVNRKHNLKQFQEQYPMYDRIVPVLGEISNIPGGGI